MVLSLQQGHTNRLLAVEQYQDLFYNKTRRLTQNTLRETRGNLVLPAHMAPSQSWSAAALNTDLSSPQETRHAAACRTLKHPLRTSTRNKRGEIMKRSS